MNNGLLEHLEAFVAIAESGSVTAASIALGTTQATLSRQLAALEKHLGCRLLHRSTRAISLTQDGVVVLSPHKGCYVGDFDENVLRDHFEHLRARRASLADHRFDLGVARRAAPGWDSPRQLGAPGRTTTSARGHSPWCPSRARC